MATPEFTERQKQGWAEVAALLHEHGIDISPDRPTYGWHVTWADEARPGRGHYFNGVYCDGEVFVQVVMDVYGGPSVSIADLSWVHIDGDEEHDCEVCGK